MATDVSAMSNGNYAPHQSYAGMDHNNFAYGANSASVPSQSASQPPASSSTPSNSQTQQPPQPDISKDEVGWYFVEQYYTTLSRSPEKLYLFYNKRSQFVSGQETDKVQVCIGQRAINDKIKELDFQECKVRVTNVDSQASDSNIVIQVIGEISNKGQPHRKFTQTFVLATQTNGYFVLNDIFRYLIDEEEEPEADTTAVPVEEVQQVPGMESGYLEPAPTETETKTLTSSDDPVAIEHDAKEVSKEIEEKLVPTQAADEEPTVATNGEPAAKEAAVEETPAVVDQPESTPVAEVEEPAAAEEMIQAEKPKDPEPTPVPSPPKQVAPQPAVPSKPAAPAVPMSWASRAAAANRVAAAANRVATPAAPAAAASSSTKPAASTSAAPKPVTPIATPPAPQSTAAPSTALADPTSKRLGTPDSQDEWNTVGHNRQQSKPVNVQQPEQPQHRGYIKNVHDHVDFNELKAILENFGELLYVDIARQKNCAFVDFKTEEGYNKAINTPFKLGEDELFVEERRMRPGSTPFIPRGQFQGGGGRGRGGAGGQGPPRGGFQNNRGNPRGRGAYGAQRGARGGGAAPPA